MGEKVSMERVHGHIRDHAGSGDGAEAGNEALGQQGFPPLPKSAGTLNEFGCSLSAPHQATQSPQLLRTPRFFSDLTAVHLNLKQPRRREKGTTLYYPSIKARTRVGAVGSRPRPQH